MQQIWSIFFLATRDGFLGGAKIQWTRGEKLNDAANKKKGANKSLKRGVPVSMSSTHTRKAVDFLIRTP
jgi:hypothetical protein